MKLWATSRGSSRTCRTRAPMSTGSRDRFRCSISGSSGNSYTSSIETVEVMSQTAERTRKQREYTQSGPLSLAANRSPEQSIMGGW